MNGPARQVETKAGGLRQALRERIGRTYVPGSLYRLQLHAGFTFRQAEELVPYLQDLGVGAVYLSPFFKAVPGSTHGYDITDPNVLNPEIGTWIDYERFCEALRRAGLGQVVDIVPNHMGIAGDANAFWLDVLEHGRASQFAHFFDIDWQPVKSELQEKVLLPVLPDLYGRVLESQRLRLHFRDGRFHLRCQGADYPLSPVSCSIILEHGLEDLEVHAPHHAAELAEYRSIVEAVRLGQSEAAGPRLGTLARRSALIRRFLSGRLAAFNGRRGHPASFDLLHALLDAQAYRLAHWRVAADEINYRRFFNINELAALRIEDERVFEHCHRLLFRLIREGKVQGLRVDHPDGLYDPPGYLRQLQQGALRQSLVAQTQIHGEAAVSLMLGDPEFREAVTFYVLVEKILDRSEPLPEDWAVCGTVGYEALNALNGLFIDGTRETSVHAVYETFCGIKMDFERLAYRSKKFFTRRQMGGEVEALGHRLDTISERSPRYRDFTRSSLTIALREVIDCFPVYRTYTSPSAQSVSPRDERYIRVAIERAKATNPALNPEVFDFLCDVLLLKLEADVPQDQRALYRDFVLRFQQLTAPVRAKGVEDTAFYVDCRLLSLNEVGGDPDHFGCTVADFHAQNAERAFRWPAGGVATSTHDTKRSEDVRLRLDVISELPEEWAALVGDWAALNERHKTVVSGRLEPQRNTEYFIYQTLLGAWPDEELTPEGLETLRERFWAYLLKALREAKLHTDWTDPATDYEEAVRKFLMALLSPSPNTFLDRFLPFQRRVSRLGKLNSLSCLCLKMACPGVADTYQGTELWDYSLVDPDNRRPVDFQRRRRLLEAIDRRLQAGPTRQAVARELFAAPRDGAIKLYCLREALRARRRHPGLFVGAQYAPLNVEGLRQNNVVAFLRRDGSDLMLSAAGRFFSRLSGEGSPGPLGSSAWEDTSVVLPGALAGLAFEDVFTGRCLRPAAGADGAARLKVSELFSDLSAAMLIHHDGH